MTQKSRIKQQSESELDEVRQKVANLPRGKLDGLCRMAEVSRTAVWRFKNGKLIALDKFKQIEIALREEAA